MKTAKQNGFDAAGICDRLEVMVRFARFRSEIAGLERGKTTADPHRKARRVGKEMRHHLCVNGGGNGLALPV